ncbi:MAG: TIM barrel protein [Acidobacteriaceae bacterium]
MTIASNERSKQQQALVERLYEACGGSYSPETRRKYYITGPQWAAAYQGQALFYAPVREPVSPAEVMRHFAEIGIGYWTCHDTDVIPTQDLMTDRQAEIIAGLKKSLTENGLRCSMVTGETFFNEVWSASPAAESPDVRAYAAKRLKNVVRIGHELEAQFVVYWPGTLGYMMQGIIDEPQTLKWFAEALNAACEEDIACAKQKNRPTLKHCLEAKPFEPQAQIILPTTDAMLTFINSGMLTHPEMVGVNPEYLHELMWGGAPRASLARAIIAGKLWHFDVNDGYPLKHDVDLPVALVNPLDWLNVLMLLRAHSYEGPFNYDYKPPRTTSNWGVFKVSFPAAVDRFITLWEMAGEALADPLIHEATEALKSSADIGSSTNAREIFEAGKELLTLHELIAHRLVQILIGSHRGRRYLA